MRLVEQRIVSFLVFALCAFAPHESLPRTLAVLPVQAAAQTGRSTENEPFEKLAARAQAALDAERIPEAIRLYDRATKLRPGWPEGWWHLGTLLFDAQRFAEARDAFAHFVTTEKKQPGPGFGMLGLSEFELAHYPQAQAALEKSIRLGIGNDAAFVQEVLIHSGMVNARSGKPEIALQRLTLAANQIAAANPEAPNEAVFSDQKLLDAFGVAALRIPNIPTKLSPEQLPVVRLAGRVQALIALQDRAAAETELKQLVALYASQPGVNYMHGVFLLKEHPPLAVDAFRREMEVSPSDASPRIQLAFEFLRAGEYEQGLEYAQEAARLAPDNFVAHVACGRLWLETGKTDSAVKELLLAVKLAPGSPDAHFALSRAFAAAGRAGEAAHERAEFERLKAASDTTDQ